MAKRNRRRDADLPRRPPVEIEDFEWVDTRSMATGPRADAEVLPTEPRDADPVESRSGEPDSGEPEQVASAPDPPAAPAVLPGEPPRPGAEARRARVAARVRARATAGVRLGAGAGTQARVRARAIARSRERAGQAAAPGFGDLLAAGSSLGLLICMFAMAWYGVAGVPDPSYARPALATTADGWNGLPVVRWVIVVTVVVAAGSLVLHLTQRRHGVRTETGAAVVLLGCATAALLLWRVLIALPGGGKVIDQKLGALVGLGCAFGILWGGVETLHESRRAASADDRLEDASREEAGAPGRRRRRGSPGSGPTKEGPK